MTDRSAYPSQAREAVDDTAFAWSAARGLADLETEDTTGDALILRLCLSTWMRNSGTDHASAQTQLLVLRKSLVEASGLDAASEPVPLVGGDERRSLLNVATYVHGLIIRAAGSAGADPLDLVEGILSAGVGRVLALL